MNESVDRRFAGVTAGRVASVAMLLIGVVISVALVWYSFQQRTLFANSITEQFQKHQETIADGVSRGIEGMVRRVTGYMQSMAASPEVMNPYSLECRNRIQEFYFANQDVVSAGTRMNAAGLITYTYPVNETALNADISHQEHVKALFMTKDLVVSGMFHAVQGFDAIAIHAPVYRAGALDGSVAALIPMSKITQVYIGRVKSGVKGFAWLVDENGTIMDYPDEYDRVYTGKKLLEVDLFTPKVRKKLMEYISRGQTDSVKLGNTLFAVSPIRLGARKWTVVLSTPYEDLTGPIVKQWHLQWLLNGAVFAAMALAVTAFYLFGARAARLEREKGFLIERVGLQKELRDNRDHLDMILKTVPSGIYTVDRDRIIRSWNLTAERLVGYSADEVIGKPCELFSTDEQCRKCGMYTESIPKPIYGAECWLTTKSGTKILVSKNLDYLRDSRGNITGGIESFVDITEARKAENARLNAVAMEKEIEQLRKMDEVKSNFLSMVSHELRTPLSVMLGNLSMARKQKYGDISQELKDKLDVILRRGWQLNDLIANLLDLAKIESGKLDLKKENIFVARKLDEVMSEFSEEIERKSLVIETSVPRSSVIPADPSMFHRLMENLVGNAVKFTPEGGRISISLMEDEGVTVISVKDTGPGIPKKSLSRIFERFYQVDDSSTRKYGGTGLGLSIAREIMEVHKGRIEMRSEEGMGSEVLVFFMMEADKDEADPAVGAAVVEEKALPAPWFGEPRTFLYVGADPEFLTTLTVIFESTAHRVISFQDHAAAARAIEKENVRVVVLDIDMPGIEERELSMWKKLGEDGYKLLVVSVSEFKGENFHRLAAVSGSASLLAKPLEEKTFISEIKAFLS